MRIHTGLHLLSVVLPFPVTGGSIGADEGRLDFDIDGDVPAKEAIEEKLNALVAADYAGDRASGSPTRSFSANPGLVKTMKVKPPMGSGKRAARPHRRHRPAALRRHARPLHRRDRPPRRSARSRARASRTAASASASRSQHVMRPIASLVRLDRVARRPSRRSRRRHRRRLLAPADHRPRRGARSMTPRIFPAPSSSTSTPSPTRPTPCPTCCRPPRPSPPLSARSASTRNRRSSSMTASACRPRRASGGRSG